MVFEECWYHFLRQINSIKFISTRKSVKKTCVLFCDIQTNWTLMLIQRHYLKKHGKRIMYFLDAYFTFTNENLSEKIV